MFGLFCSGKKALPSKLWESRPVLRALSACDWEGIDDMWNEALYILSFYFLIGVILPSRRDKTWVVHKSSVWLAVVLQKTVIID